MNIDTCMYIRNMYKDILFIMNKKVYNRNVVDSLKYVLSHLYEPSIMFICYFIPLYMLALLKGKHPDQNVDCVIDGICCFFLCRNEYSHPHVPEIMQEMRLRSPPPVKAESRQSQCNLNLSSGFQNFKCRLLIFCSFLCCGFI